MSAFTEAMASGIDAIYASLGESAVYEDRDGWRTECTVIPQRDLNQYGNTVEVNARSFILAVRRTEVDARPRKNEVFELAGDDRRLTIDSVVLSDEFEHRVLVS